MGTGLGLRSKSELKYLELNLILELKLELELELGLDLRPVGKGQERVRGAAGLTACDGSWTAWRGGCRRATR